MGTPYVRLDGHIHSKFSGDPYLKWSTPSRIVNKAFERRLDVIIVTDSNNDVFVCRSTNINDESAWDPHYVVKSSTDATNYGHSQILLKP